MTNPPNAELLAAGRMVRTLFGDANDLDRVPWQPFHPGVEIFYLYQADRAGAAAAMLNYAPGARVPRHRHAGYEHVLVLRGSQSDEHGHYAAGAFVINPPGSEHAVWSEAGCVALLIWEKPPVMIG